MGKYLTADEIASTLKVRTIRAIEHEFIDGRPRLVMYFDGEEKGLPLTRQLAEDLSEAFGRNRRVDEFFAKEGQLH